MNKNNNIPVGGYNRQKDASKANTAEMPALKNIPISNQRNIIPDIDTITQAAGNYGIKRNNNVEIPAKSIVNNNSDEGFYSNKPVMISNMNNNTQKNYNSQYGAYDPDGIRISQPNPYPNPDRNIRNVPPANVPVPSPKPAPKKKKKKKKGGCFAAVLISLLLVVAIISGSIYGYVFSLCKKVKKEELKSNITSGLLSDKKIKNILLLGTDKENDGISRSDTMMLLSIDTKTQEIKLTSFLRDMWVEIPGNGSAKLNASYAYGGQQLTVDTLETNFKIDIDHFILVDFEMFQRIIDSLGGVTVDITERESDFLNQNTRVNCKPGKNKLSGEDALIYARIRKLDSDFYRTRRQRKVISAIIEKAKKTNPIELSKLLSEIMPLIRTDIEPKELTNLAFSALKYIKYDIEQLQVPADDAYSSQTISGQAALVPDMEENTDNIHSFIYGKGK